ncbi:MAG TPA: site-2 protease family protein [Acidimicrobiales bacterium]|jgi:membrane-associated protease RseP (regulator of RpoE activity)|nr:site-2 protease family protein [Acidimicrobiales bacterium]
MTDVQPGSDETNLDEVAPEAPAEPKGLGRPPAGDVYETSGARVAVVVLGILALGFWRSWPTTVVILGIVLMLFLHEAGHFVTAKWSGMKATEFFIGFGPKLWSFTRGETEYGIKALPAGAYVRIIGMNNLDEVAPEDEPRAYRQQSFPKRLLVVLAGPATHFVMAWIILFVLLVGYGLPTAFFEGEDAELQSKDWNVNSVTDDSAASAAGLQAGDKVVAFDGHEVSTFGELTDEIQAGEVGQEVTLTVLRDGDEFDTTTKLVGRPADAGGSPGTPFLGVGPAIVNDAQKLGVIEAAGKATTGVGTVTRDSVAAIGGFFSPSGISGFADTVSRGADDQQSSGSSSGGSVQSEPDDSNRMLSIVGAVRLGAQLGEEGLAGLLVFFLSINIFVGLLNLLPLLPFDGGHAAVAVYERIRSRDGRAYHADVTKLLPVAYAVVMGLVVLGVTTLYLDIVNPVSL